ncbi:MAG TPA: TonB-dependent receptor [Puia sp.]|nr:TonB-dependent receptor [Puia sp.]
MKNLIFSLLSLLLLQDALGQVSGKLTTAGSQPITFANVLLLKGLDSSLVKATVTNEKGDYRFDNIGPGRYLLRVSSVGYLTWESPLFDLTVSQKEKDLGTRVLQETSKQLGEVVVRAEKPPFQQRADGTVVNVESSLLSKGSSALEVLERSPGVVIDHRNNSIALDGKNGVTVMIDGKLVNMPIEQVFSLLNGLSADDLEKIELLTTPPARYDANGSAGLINIVLKKNKKRGTNGSLSITGGYGKGEKGTASLHLSHNTEKTNLYGSYTFSHNRTYSDMYITSSQNMPFLGGQMDVVVWDTTKSLQNSQDASLGIDHKLNSKTTVGGSINYNGSHGSSNTVNHSLYNILPDSLLLFDGSIGETSRWNNWTSSVYAERMLRKGEKINFDIDYLSFNTHSPSEVQSSFLDKNGTEAGGNDTLFSPRQRGFANTLIQVGVGKIDYTRQFSKKWSLEAGVKGTYTRSTSQSGIESLVNGSWVVARSETSNNILMKEGIGAAYASANAQLSPSTNLVIGSRYEYSHTRMDNPQTGKNTVDRKLGVLFPNLLLSQKLSDQSELQLSYSKRISRPSYNDLASYVGYSDPSAVYTGNPFLQPTITHNLKLGYNYRGYSFSALFSRDVNPIARYQITESPLKDVLYVSPQNLQWQNNLSFQANLPWKVGNWWSMNYSFVGSWRQFKEDYTQQPVEKTYFSYSLNFSQSFTLPKNFSAEISGWYNSWHYNGTVKIAGLGALNAGIKKELNNNGGSFQLSVSDLLRTIRFNAYYGTLTEEAFSIKNHVDFNTESAKMPIIKLTYSRSFGSSTGKSQRKQGAGSEDERDRIRKD